MKDFRRKPLRTQAAATDICGKVPFDLIISDTGCKVPDAGIPFIALSTDASIDSAVKAVRSGAQDFLTKPIDMNRLLQSIHRTIANPATAPPAAAGSRRAPQPPRASRAGGKHHRHLARDRAHVRQLIDKGCPVRGPGAHHRRERHGQGAGGTLAPRQARSLAAPFVEVNCAAIPSELIESELFRPRTGCIHLGHQTAQGQVRAGRRRHALHGRDRRHVAGGAGQGAAGAAREPYQPRGQRQGHRGGRAGDRRYEQGSARRDQKGQFPRRPLPPHRRDRRAGPGAPGARRDIRRWWTISSAPSRPNTAHGPKPSTPTLWRCCGRCRGRATSANCATSSSGSSSSEDRITARDVKEYC